jgi:signal peptidase
MEPAFYRGDLLFLTNPVHERYHTGDITVYKVPGADIPIVHRVLETHDIKRYVRYQIYVVLGSRSTRSLKDSEIEPVTDQLLLTKGDNNAVDDLDLYQGLDWLERRHIVGKVRG